ATVRGTAALSQMDVRDGQRTVLKVDRAAATALDVDWPRAIKVGELTLRQPWVLLERDATGALPLRALLLPETAARTQPAMAAATNDSTSADSPRPPVVLALNHLAVGGVSRSNTGDAANRDRRHVTKRPQCDERAHIRLESRLDAGRQASGPSPDDR